MPIDPNDPNTTITDMRNHIKSLEADLTAAKKEAEGIPDLQGTIATKEAEISQLRTSLSEQAPNAETLTAFTETLTELYEAEINSAPEQVRDKLRTLSSVGSLPDKIKQVRAAKELISSNVVSVTPINPTTPSGAPNATVPAVTSPTQPPAPFVPPGWNAVLKVPTPQAQQV